MKHGEPKSWSTDQKPDRSCPRTLARDRRPNPGRRREGASQATPHRHADVSSSPRRKRLPRLLWPGPTLRAAAQRRHRETFIPLGHLPGQRLEADFGHIHVDFPEGRRLVPFLVTTWAYSNAPFVLRIPFERTEAILAGMVAAFEFFGCIPKEVWWDNPKTVATLILLGRQRQIHPRYAAVASHYAFNPLFCMPARGNGKTLMPSRPSRPCNAGSPRQCRERLTSTSSIRLFASAVRPSVSEWFSRSSDHSRWVIASPKEQATASHVPDMCFDACVIRPAAPVDKYQTAAFDCNRYSVPRPFAFQMVTVKGFIDRVVIVAAGQVIATHARSLQRGTLILDPDPLSGHPGPQARSTRPHARVP